MHCCGKTPSRARLLQGASNNAAGFRPARDTLTSLPLPHSCLDDGWLHNRGFSHLAACSSGRPACLVARGRNRKHIVVARSIFDPPPFNPTQLTVQYIAGATRTHPVPPLPRRYTLTHNDITGALCLSIGVDYNQPQISGFYTRLLRDEVVAEWVFDSCPSLHLYCHVSGEEKWLAPPWLRDYIFRREIPLVLETFAYADKQFLEDHMHLAAASVYVHFQSNIQDLDLIEYWGVLGDRSTWRKIPTSIMQRLWLTALGRAGSLPLPVPSAAGPSSVLPPPPSKAPAAEPDGVIDDTRLMATKPTAAAAAAAAQPGVAYDVAVASSNAVAEVATAAAATGATGVSPVQAAVGGVLESEGVASRYSALGETASGEKEAQAVVATPASHSQSHSSSSARSNNVVTSSSSSSSSENGSGRAAAAWSGGVVANAIAVGPSTAADTSIALQLNGHAAVNALPAAVAGLDPSMAAASQSGGNGASNSRGATGDSSSSSISSSSIATDRGCVAEVGEGDSELLLQQLAVIVDHTRRLSSDAEDCSPLGGPAEVVPLPDSVAPLSVSIHQSC